MAQHLLFFAFIALTTANPITRSAGTVIGNQKRDRVIRIGQTYQTIPDNYQDPFFPQPIVPPSTNVPSSSPTSTPLPTTTPSQPSSIATPLAVVNGIERAGPPNLFAAVLQPGGSASPSPSVSPTVQLTPLLTPLLTPVLTPLLTPLIAIPLTPIPTPTPTPTPTPSITSSPAATQSQTEIHLCISSGGAIASAALGVLGMDFCPEGVTAAASAGASAGASASSSGSPPIIIGGYVGSEKPNVTASIVVASTIPAAISGQCIPSGNAYVMSDTGAACNPMGAGQPIGGVGGDGHGGIQTLGPGGPVLPVTTPVRNVFPTPSTVVSGNMGNTGSGGAAANENTGIPGSNPKWNNGFGTPPGNGTDFIGSDVCGNGGCKSLQEFCAAVKRNGKHDRVCDNVGSTTGSAGGGVGNGTFVATSAYAYASAGNNGGSGSQQSVGNYVYVSQPGGGTNMTRTTQIPGGSQQSPIVPGNGINSYGGGGLVSSPSRSTGSQQTGSAGAIVSQPGSGSNNLFGGGAGGVVSPSPTKSQTYNPYAAGGIGLGPTGGVQILGPGGPVGSYSRLSPSPSPSRSASNYYSTTGNSTSSNSTTGIGAKIQVTVTLQSSGCGSTFSSCGFLGSNGSAQAGMSVGYMDLPSSPGQCGSCWRLDSPTQLCGSPPSPCGQDTTSQPIIVMVDSSCAPDNSASRPWAEQCNQRDGSKDKLGSQSAMSLCADSGPAVQTWFGARAKAQLMPGQVVMNLAQATRVDCSQWAGKVDRRADWYRADPAAGVKGLVS